MSLKRVEIDKGWEFKQSTTLNNGTAKDYLPVSQFPTVAHLDLLHHKLIPDPYIDTNELDVLWVNDANWTYHTSFPSPSLSPGEKAGKHHPHTPLFLLLHPPFPIPWPKKY